MKQLGSPEAATEPAEAVVMQKLRHGEMKLPSNIAVSWRIACGKASAIFKTLRGMVVGEWPSIPSRGRFALTD